LPYKDGNGYLYNLFIITVSLQKQLSHFLLIRNNGEIHSNRHFLGTIKCQGYHLYIEGCTLNHANSPIRTSSLFFEDPNICECGNVNKTDPLASLQIGLRIEAPQISCNYILIYRSIMWYSPPSPALPYPPLLPPISLCKCENLNGKVR